MNTFHEYLLFSFRSSSKPLPKPSQKVAPENLRCAVCGQFSFNGSRKKSRVCEDPRADSLYQAAKFFMDSVFTRIVTLENRGRMFAADVYCHKTCLNRYIAKWERQSTKVPIDLEVTFEKDKQNQKRDIFKQHVAFIQSVIDQGKGLAISDIRDMINQENASDLTNKEIKSFLIDELGDTILFCQPERKNQSQFVFSSSIDVNHVVNSLRNLNVIKEAAITIRKSPLEVNFGLDDSFCDAQQLKQSWRETKIPSSLVTFFSALFNISSTKLMKSETSPEIDNDILDNPEDEDEDDTEISDSLLMTKAKSLFQILHYHVSGGRQKTPVHVMNAHAIYERCRSRELITSFNRQSTCISYISMKL